MTKIATRRTFSSSAPTFSRPLISASRRCSTSGTTRSFETMIDSATDSTITMAVAADRPPTKAVTVSRCWSRPQRQRQHEHVAVDRAGRKGHQAGERDRHHEQVDQHQIEREQPAGAADFALAVVLHHRDVELARQQHDREERQQRRGEEGAERRAAREDRRRRRMRAAPSPSSAPGPSNIQKVTKTPTARKATSLTIDSVATASIKPS